MTRSRTLTMAGIIGLVTAILLCLIGPPVSASAPVLGFTPVPSHTPTPIPTETPPPTPTPAPTETPPPTPTHTPSPAPTTTPPPAAPPSPRLTILKTVDRTDVLAGSQVTFTLRVCNEGNAGADNVIVSDVLSPALEVVGASATQGTVAATNNEVRADLGALAPGGCAEISLLTRVHAHIAPRTQIANVATANGQASNEAMVTVIIGLPVTGGSLPLARVMALVSLSVLLVIAGATSIWGQRLWPRRPQ